MLTRQKKYRLTQKGLLNRIYHDQKCNSIKAGREPPAYSMVEFRERYLNDRIFLERYKIWEQSGYTSFLRPCFDRIDCFKPYSFNNLQIIYCRENQQKGLKERELYKAKKEGRYAKFYEEIYCRHCEDDRIHKIEIYENFKSYLCTICLNAESDFKEFRE